MSSRPFTLLALAVLAAALAAPAARADIDVESVPSIKAKSTLAPEGEVETYRFAATAGTQLTFSLAAVKRGHLTFAPVLFGPDDQVVPFGTGVLVATKTGVSVKNLPLPLTGTYRLTVTAAGTGDYSIALVGAAQKAFKSTQALVPTGDQTIAFSAPPGSSVTFSAKRAPGSAATPLFGMLAGQDYGVDLSVLGRKTPASHVATVKAVGGSGDLTVKLGTTAAAGDAVVAITVKPPKLRTAKLDLRSVRLGHDAAGGGETFVTRVVGPDGGLVAAGASSDLSGASVDIPAGALPGSLPISVASATTPKLPSGDDQPAGPAVDLRPSGTTFKTAVTVTLPFDFSLLPANASPSDIRVLIRESDGSTRTVTPLSFDAINGTVTLQTSGFSVCIPIVRSGLTRIGLSPGGDEYWTLFFHDSMSDDPQNNDSRGRDFELNVGEASFFGDGSIQVSDEKRSFQVDNQDDGLGGLSGTVTATVTPDSGTAGWNYGFDGHSIDITGGGSDTPHFEVSRDGVYMAGKGESSSATKAELDILVRKNTAPLTVASLDGVYHFVAVEVHGETSGPGQPALAKPDHTTGNITFDGKGHFTIAGTDRRSRFDGTVWSDSAETLGVSSTYSLETQGTFLMSIPPQQAGDTGSVFRLFPGPNADVLLGSDQVAQSGDLFAIVLVKQASGLSVKSLDGPYRSASIETNVGTYTVTPAGGQQPATFTIGDLGVRDEQLSFVFDGTSSVTLASVGHEILRDPGTTGGVQVQNDSDSFAVTVALDSKGNLKVRRPPTNEGIDGALSPDAMFGIFTNSVQGSTGHHMLGVTLKSPPPFTGPR